MLLGQPARLALLQRLLPILGSIRGLQRATVQAGSVEFMQKVAALSRAQAVRIAKVPSARSATVLTNWRALEWSQLCPVGTLIRPPPAVEFHYIAAMQTYCIFLCGV
jgi:hypothetical protein